MLEKKLGKTLLNIGEGVNLSKNPSKHTPLFNRRETPLCEMNPSSNEMNLFREGVCRGDSTSKTCVDRY